MDRRLQFRGTSYKDLMAFPELARQEAGYQLGLVQGGGVPDDWKPMSSIGPGVQEIRLHEAAGAFRVVYVAKFAAGVFVLHCFQKKTQKTAKLDIELASQRYRELAKELGHGQ
jgi:phage-related protein